MTEEARKRRRTSHLWGSIWIGIFLVGLGILLALKVEFLPAFLILLGMLILIGGVVRWYGG